MGAVLLLVGLQLNEGLWSTFLIQLGLALITAGILGLITGWYLRERLLGQIASRVSDMLAEFRAEAIDAFHLQKLPQEILEVVRTKVINEPIIQRDLRTHYQMEIVDIGDKKALRSKITSSSTYENLTSEWRSSEIYEVGSALDDAFKGLSKISDSGFFSIDTDPESGTLIPSVHLDKAGMVLYTSPDYLGQPIFRHPVQFSPKCRITVMTVEVGYFLFDDWENYPVSRPTITMEIRVSALGEAEQVNFDVRPDDCLKYNFHRSVEDDGTLRGYIDCALLPGQGMNFQWSRVREADSQQ